MDHVPNALKVAETPSEVFSDKTLPFEKVREPGLKSDKGIKTDEKIVIKAQKRHQEPAGIFVAPQLQTIGFDRPGTATRFKTSVMPTLGNPYKASMNNTVRLKSASTNRRNMRTANSTSQGFAARVQPVAA